jgi:hypothetical protein
MKPSKNRFSAAFINVPAKGVPIKIPIPAKQNDMPIQVPKSFISGTRLATIVTGNVTAAPERKPVNNCKHGHPSKIPYRTPCVGKMPQSR